MTEYLLRATDLSNVLQCDRLVYLAFNGDQWLRVEPPALLQLLFERGKAFETLVAERVAYVTPRYRLDDLEEGYRATMALMRRGADTIYQPVLMADDLVGIPDLLVRAPGHSWFGDYAYRPIDIKYASTATNNHRIQVMAYLYLLERTQGVMGDGAIWLRPKPEEDPRDGTVVEEPVVFDPVLFNDTLAQARDLAAGAEPMPFISSACDDCDWREHCRPLAESARDVSLLPGMRRQVWNGLHQRGLGTLRALAGTTPEQLITIKGVGDKTAVRFINLARAVTSGEMLLLEPPEFPDARTEIFFDVESAPLEGLYYLMGTLIRRGRKAAFEYDLAEKPADEEAMWQGFLRRISRTDGPIYHYGSYERLTLNTLNERYGPDDRVADILERMIDLSKALDRCVVLPLTRHSLKDVAGWLGFHWGGATATADDSVVEYITWLETGQRTHLDNILQYNEDDCRATLEVRDWLGSLGEHS
jgi:predicted RecB family nuclease